jgi:radical SAM protein with 4Fe4S-binding SPASM domain
VQLQLPKSDDPLEVILKVTGETCNINCNYCYEKRKPYDNATFLTPEHLRSFLDTLGSRPLLIGLHGGEPLLIGVERMRALLREFQRYPARVEMSIQTNATLLTREWLDLFAEEWPEISIGVSLDGPPGLNRFRVDYQDRDTYSPVERALRLLEEYSWKVGLLCVVTRLALGHEAELLKYFAQFPVLRAVNFLPCLDYNVKTKKFPTANRDALVVLNGTGEGRPGWATEPLEYADFLIRAFDHWREGEYFKQFALEPPVSIIRVLAGKPPFNCHFTEQKCAFVLTVYPDGRVGSCDELSMPDSYLGQLGSFGSIDEILYMQRNQQLPERLQRLLDKCAGCDFRLTCGGGCLATRLRYSETPFDDQYCDYRMKVVSHVAAQVGRDPTRGLSARHDSAKVDINSPRQSEAV